MSESTSKSVAVDSVCGGESAQAFEVAEVEPEPTLTREQLMEELAYRACVMGQKYVSRFAERHGISRMDYIMMVADPAFHDLLKKFTMGYCYLPRHAEQVHARLDQSKRGDQSARTEVFGQYLQEGPSGNQSVIEVERIRMMGVQKKVEDGIGEFLRG